MVGGLDTECVGEATRCGISAQLDLHKQCFTVRPPEMLIEMRMVFGIASIFSGIECRYDIHCFEGVPVFTMPRSHSN